MWIAIIDRRRIAAVIVLTILQAATVCWSPGRPNSITAGGSVWGSEPPAEGSQQAEAIKRAISYLSAEVATWNREHACYSCHNSGDAIRALLLARRHGHQVDFPELQTTIAWLRRPGQWSSNGPDGEFNDRRLARLQFASALAAAESAAASGHRPLRIAAEMLATELQPNGVWPSNQVGTIGSPITYGPFLATLQARNVLRQAASGPQSGQGRLAEKSERANQWLRTSQPKSVLNAAAVLWAMTGDSHPEASAARARCLELIHRDQSDDGGWGAYVNSVTEPFDTAMVLLALHACGDREHARRIAQGRAFLINTQSPDGSWPETTRPPGRQSYAHRVSTAAWCLQALVTVPAAGNSATP